MGFGTLFVGYFLLINITYFEYTDIIAAMLMLMAAYKLTFVNKYFKYAMYAATFFALFAFGELIFSLINFFAFIPHYKIVLSYVAFTRYTLIFILCVFFMRGISDVAEEVELLSLHRSAKKWANASFIYLIAGFFEIPFATNFLGSVLPYVYLAALLSILAYHTIVLYTVYRAFKDIIMPEQDIKKSKGTSFTDKLWNRIEEGNREYAEYKLAKKNSKKGKK
jgi:hypothetical protein